MAKGKSRKIPQRMCVSCREMKDKKALFRLLVEDEQIVYDPTGKKAGRGAYICKDKACIEQAVSKGKLRYHLKAEPAPALAEQLLAALEREAEAEAKAKRGKKVFRLSADGRPRELTEEDKVLD